MGDVKAVRAHGLGVGFAGTHPACGWTAAA